GPPSASSTSCAHSGSTSSAYAGPALKARGTADNVCRRVGASTWSDRAEGDRSWAAANQVRLRRQDRVRRLAAFWRVARDDCLPAGFGSDRRLDGLRHQGGALRVQVDRVVRQARPLRHLRPVREHEIASPAVELPELLVDVGEVPGVLVDLPPRARGGVAASGYAELDPDELLRPLVLQDSEQLPRLIVE